MSDLFQNIGGREVPRDVCARKHGGNEQSVAAFASGEISRLLAQSKVMCLIVGSGDHGKTVDELSVLLDTTPNAISGRVTELKMKSLIEKRGTRKTRSGCSAAVWVAK